ncbi:MAG: hypothetical protein R3234_03345 [Thermoanaerobaculia bacterium]|nr:hypothetical protein [Thermoanaerobaculia bacterium]
MSDPIEKLVAKIESGDPEPVYLVVGDLVLAEPAARRLATALVDRFGCEIQVRRRPEDLVPLLDDLQTFSLFSPGKVVLVVDSAILADRKEAAGLVAEALEADEPSDSGLTSPQRESATRLLQALRLFEIDPGKQDPGEAVAQLPDWALAGNKRGRLGKRQAESRRQKLTDLLAAAVGEDLQGIGDEALTLLGDALRRGLPTGHALILAERSVAEDHPLVTRLRERESLHEAGTVATQRRGGWRGVDRLAARLEEDVGVEIRGEALEELARRTLRQEGRRDSQARGDTTARFAAEYRKLAEISGGEAIDRRLVTKNVEDRGEEDVWAILDAVGEGRTGDALDRLDRMLGGAESSDRALFSFFSLLASFCRQLVAIRGLLDRLEIPAGEGSYSRFKDRLAPALSRELPEGIPNPLGRLHPFRLHRAYLAAGRLSSETAASLPWKVLEAEQALKGESGDRKAALARLLAELGV